MSVLIDASVLAAWFLDERRDPRVEAAFDMVARVETRAPNLLYYEIRNALLMGSGVASLEAIRPRSFAILRYCLSGSRLPGR